MIIPINEDYRIETDEHQWILKNSKAYRNKKTGELKVTWTPVGYYPTFEGTVNALADRMLRTSKVVGMEEAIGIMKSIKHELSVLVPKLSFEIK